MIQVPTRLYIGLDTVKPPGHLGTQPDFSRQRKKASMCLEHSWVSRGEARECQWNIDLWNAIRLYGSTAINVRMLLTSFQLGQTLE
jgi:hypothetical protein